jgi:peptidoglycan hydrolase CwlO-like protein
MSNLLEDLGTQFLLNLLNEVRAGQVRLEERMADLTTAVEDLKVAVTGVAERVANQIAPLVQALNEAQASLQAERDAAAALAASEDAEDVAQNQALADAQAATDAALVNAQAAADGITGEVDKLNQIAVPEPPPEPTV